jgi:inner membrane protein involved in colicin E2 resistance
MSRFARVLAIVGVFLGVTVAYSILGGVTLSRRHSGESGASRALTALWGSPLRQRAPSLSLVRYEERATTRTVVRDGERVDEQQRERVRVLEPVTAASSRVDARLHLDTRRRGLVFFSLYDVRFDERVRYVHEATEPGVLHVDFAFPDPRGLYDDFVLEVDGVAREEARRPTQSGVSFEVPVAPKEAVEIHIAYKSRGQGTFSYAPGDGVRALRDFELRMSTDFHDIDFAEESLSPTARERTAEGEIAIWRFASVITGRELALRMPEPLQPGELASGLAFSAPIALLLYFVVLEVLTRHAGRPFHPLHYLLVAAGFFAFHLLFAYTADRLPVERAFALSALTSVALVTSYVGALAGPRFALGPSLLAQLVYLVGFSLAHFARGSTGLTVTVLAIATLFVVMQWSAWRDRRAREAERASGA